MASLSLKDKVAFITGGASGIGAATAILFAEAGAKVVIADLHSAVGDRVVAEIQAAGGEAIFVGLNVSSTASIEAAIATTVSKFGRLDIAVNNAGIGPEWASVTNFSEDKFDSIIAVNLKGTAVCMKHELRQMIAQGGGGSGCSIINTSSVNGFKAGGGNNLAYVAAKSAVVGMTKVAAVENGRHGIRVNAIAPGPVDTPMMQQALTEVAVSEKNFADAATLFGRFAKPREVAQASLWLASEASSYVTGITMPVDAGFLVK